MKIHDPGANFCGLKPGKAPAKWAFITGPFFIKIAIFRKNVSERSQFIEKNVGTERCWHRKDRRFNLDWEKTS